MRSHQPGEEFSRIFLLDNYSPLFVLRRFSSSRKNSRSLRSRSRKIFFFLLEEENKAGIEDPFLTLALTAFFVIPFF